jgi:hypothetical protein
MNDSGYDAGMPIRPAALESGDGGTVMEGIIAYQVVTKFERGERGTS